MKKIFIPVAAIMAVAVILAFGQGMTETGGGGGTTFITPSTSGGGGGGGTVTTINGTAPIISTTADGITYVISFQGTNQFNASGSTNLNASSLASGTVPYARLPVDTATNLVQGSGITVTPGIGTSNGTYYIAATGVAGASAVTNANNVFLTTSTNTFGALTTFNNRVVYSNTVTLVNTPTQATDRSTAEIFNVTLTNLNTTLTAPINGNEGEKVMWNFTANNTSNLVTFSGTLRIPTSSTLTSPITVLTNTTTTLLVQKVGTNWYVRSYIYGYPQ